MSTSSDKKETPITAGFQPTMGDLIIVAIIAVFLTAAVIAGVFFDNMQLLKVFAIGGVIAGLVASTVFKIVENRGKKRNQMDAN